MDGCDPHAVARELVREPIGPVLGSHEDERRGHVAVRDQMAQRLALARVLDAQDDMLDQGGRRVRRGHLDRGRVAQQLLGEPSDGLGEGRREEEALSLGRQQADDRADVVDEAHVEHPIGLVEDEELDGAEVDRSPPHEVKEPTRGGDDDLGAGLELTKLIGQAGAAVHGHRPQGSMLAVGLDALLDLDGQLTRWNQDQGAHGASVNLDG